MTRITTTRRPASLGLTLMIALVSALAALALSGGNDAAAHGNHAAAVTASPKALSLYRAMDRLWEEHIVWTRLAIIDLTTDAPGTKETVTRLLRNQTDIGNAVKPFYGAGAGNKLTSLLKQHILIAADLIAAARKSDTAGVAAQQARWQQNADQIASFLSSANPRYWKAGEMKAMMRNHLRLTTDEVVARLQQDWAADVEAYDKVEREILQMSEMLSDGLVKQFPARFAA